MEFFGYDTVNRWVTKLDFVNSATTPLRPITSEEWAVLGEDLSVSGSGSSGSNNLRVALGEGSLGEAPPMPEQVFFAIAPGITQRWSVKVNPKSKKRTAADFINHWNGKMIIHNQHSLYMYLAETNQICVANTSTNGIYLFKETPHDPSSSPIYFGYYAPNTAYLLNPALPSDPPPYIIPQDTPIFHVRAYIYTSQDNQTHYTREEVTYARAGIYPDTGALVAMLNSGIQMRGQRNGFIYHFIHTPLQKFSKGGVGSGTRLSIEASHRQPDPSFMEINPYPSALSLGFAQEKGVVLLRTKKRLDSASPVANLIV